MHLLTAWCRRCLRDRRGQGTVEYAFLLVFVTIIVTSTYFTMRQPIETALTAIVSVVTSALVR